MLSFRCKVTSINDNVCQKTKPLEEVNQAVLGLLNSVAAYSIRPTGSYSMAVRPIEEHPCVLRGKGTQIKYATKMFRALLHAKPNISPISAKDKVWCPMLHG